MRYVRALPVPERTDYYVQNRLEEQAEWYRGKSERNSRSARNWFLASVATQVVAIIVLIAAPTIGVLAFVGFLAALGAAFTAWNQLGRHDELKTSYSMACQELTTIKELASRAVDEVSLRTLVDDGENAISREHTMWIARRGRPIPQSVVNKFGGS